VIPALIAGLNHQDVREECRRTLAELTMHDYYSPEQWRQLDAMMSKGRLIMDEELYARCVASIETLERNVARVLTEFHSYVAASYMDSGIGAGERFGLEGIFHLDVGDHICANWGSWEYVHRVTLTLIRPGLPARRPDVRGDDRRGFYSEMFPALDIECRFSISSGTDSSVERDPLKVAAIAAVRDGLKGLRDLNAGEQQRSR
jgi:hypothetical protein